MLKTLEMDPSGRHDIKDFSGARHVSPDPNDLLPSVGGVE